METQKHPSQGIYALVTQKIIDHLEKGTIPWRMPWTKAGLPQNLISKKHYRGINLWLLNACGYPRNFFLTFKQLKELGGSVKKGEKAHIVLFWKWIEKTRENNTNSNSEEPKEKQKIPLLRYYLVFNIDQCIGIPEISIPTISLPNEPLAECEKILEGMPHMPAIEHKEQDAYYHPGKDIINMPRMDTFVCSEKYYITLFHELVHSTGHESRLNRKELMSGTFGSTNYSEEELVAEIGASFLASHAGIVLDEHEDSAAYIKGWLEVLRNDMRFIVKASALAQRAVEYILGTITIGELTEAKKQKELA